MIVGGRKIKGIYRFFEISRVGIVGRSVVRSGFEGKIFRDLVSGFVENRRVV